MSALVAWLDASLDDQRRMREVVRLFTQPESRDELGIGQIRDALSDLLFPGTSTLFTRARYFVLIPWCFSAAARDSRDASRVVERVDQYERQLIATLKSEGARDGLIGANVGAALKTLPSSLYWVGLRTYGILSDAALDASGAAELEFTRSRSHDETDDGDGRVAGAWSTAMPAAPGDFPNATRGGMDLDGREAAWLRGRIQLTTEGSLLSHLMDAAPTADSWAPWADPASASAPTLAHEVLGHARRFSFLVHGAAIVYNLLIARRYVESGYTEITGTDTRWSGELDRWSDDRTNRLDELRDWSMPAFWSMVLQQNAGVHPDSRRFVEQWHALIGADHFDVEAAERMIASRERRRKGPQSRLTNQRLLATWQGASGAGELTFRWPQVRRIVLDIHEGLARDVRA